MTDDSVQVGGPWWARSATALAAAIRDGETSSRAVVDSFLERIAAVNPAVNAAPVVFTERARAAADEADRLLAAGAPVGPLHGVPFSVKENVDLTWSATTSGVALLRDAVPEQDAVDVERMRAAGAIPLVRTNMPDVGMRWATDNALHGATVNPWDPARTAGGSSGGEGVAIATGMSPVGIGNDYGGSVRQPAYVNGVVGLKPTPGRIPMWHPGPGVFPPSAQMFSVEGPLGRTVDDVATAYGVMQGPSVVDTLTVPVAPGLFADAPRRIAVSTDPGGGGTDPAIAAAVRRAADALQAAGWEVEEAEPPHLTEAAVLWRQLMLADVTQFLFHPDAGLAQHFSADARQFIDDMAASGPALTLAEYCTATSRRLEIRSAWRVFQERYPLLLTPSLTERPFKVGEDLAGPAAVDGIWHAHRALVSVSALSLPALAVPLGSPADGLPDGVQLVGPAFGEDLCLAAGRDIERAFGPMTPIDPRPSSTKG